MQIDIVYTWVDPNNEDWLKKKNRHVSKKNSYSNHGCRYDSSLEELKYSLRSLDKYFGKYVRKIFLITNNSIPRFIRRDRSDIYVINYETLLGHESYSSITIESVIHRIPGLSEYYLYFNDDFILLKPLRISDLIDSSNGKLIWYQESNFLITAGSKFPLLAKIFNFDGDVTASRLKTYKSIKLRDTPVPISHSCRIFKKSLVKEFEREFIIEIEKLRKEMFRSKDSFCFCDAFCFWGLKKGVLNYRKNKTTKILIQVDDISSNLINNVLFGKIYNNLYTRGDKDSFLCISDIRKTNSKNYIIKDYLDETFIMKSRWEKIRKTKRYDLTLSLSRTYIMIFIMSILLLIITTSVKNKQTFLLVLALLFMSQICH